MLDKLTSGLDFQANALVLRAERQQLLAGNIANADTPGYAAKDMNFAQALREASQIGGGMSRTTAPVNAPHARHMSVLGGSAAAQLHASTYTTQTQPSMDGNSVDLDRERAAFADNAVRYEATLRFINGQGKTLLSAIQGQ